MSFTLGVACDTPHEELKKIPGIIQEIVESQPYMSFDRAHFKEYGDFSLNFEVVCHVSTSDYGIYMDARQAINLEVHKRFADEGIELPYPTQTIFVRGSDGGRRRTVVDREGLGEENPLP